MAFKIIPAVIVAVVLSGCGTHGKPLLLEAWFDSQDPCQNRSLRAEWVQPNFCGASQSRRYIYTPAGIPVGYIR